MHQQNLSMHGSVFINKCLLCCTVMAYQSLVRRYGFRDVRAIADRYHNRSYRPIRRTSPYCIQPDS